MAVEPTVSGVPTADPLEEAARQLLAGGVIALPTDTVYGIAALPHLPAATTRLFEVKRRRADVPIAVLCADGHQALDLATGVPADVHRIAERLWPGPLTLVLHRRDGLGYEIGEPATTIGLRCPAHDLVRALAGMVGPLATTSANRHGEPTPLTGEDVAAALGEDIDLVIDGGRCDGQPSTVVDFTSGEPHVLRSGAIDAATLRAAARA
jgi:L-threonylcarbamoyladenylate synthase